MKVAVVCRTQAEAVALAARLGMTQSAVPLAAESSALLGHHFTAVVIRSVNGRRNDAWWESLFVRNSGPVFVMSTLGADTGSGS